VKIGTYGGRYGIAGCTAEPLPVAVRRRREQAGAIDAVAGYTADFSSSWP